MSSDVGVGGRPAAPTSTPPMLRLEPRAARCRPPGRARWEIRLRRMTIAFDVVALAAAALGTVVVARGIDLTLAGPISIYVAAPGAVLLALCTLATMHAWDSTVLGEGSEGYNRVIRALTSTGVLIGLTGLLLGAMQVRPWVFGFAPLGAGLVLAGRYTLRKAVHSHRKQGRCMHPMLAVGPVEAVAHLIERTRRDRYTGWEVTGVCTPTGTGPDAAPDVLGVPVLGDLDSVPVVARAAGHRAVAVAPAPGWTPTRLHALAWDLEATGADLVVDPGLMEVAGPRLHVAPIDGLPLLRLTKPVFTGLPVVAKFLMDRLGAALLVLLTVPVMIAIAIAVRADGGPMFFRQTRVGRHGRPFTMIKFRSMVVGADEERAALAERDEGAGPLFKLRADPRVTRVGALIRRFSLDELPQLFNVLDGSMSLVGPRPPLPAEVATYSRDASRRLLVKPGLTGLWQVSGRSDLSWEESVRLDLRYVENWTIAQDLLILWKTIGAVCRSTGAY